MIENEIVLIPFSIYELFDIYHVLRKPELTIYLIKNKLNAQIIRSIILSRGIDI